MIIYLVRHPLTEWNKKKLLQGWEDSPLTLEGETVAHMIGEKLKERGIRKIITSDLGRCKRTAQIVNENLRVPIVETQELREQNFGEFGGKDRSFLIRLHENPALAPPKGESFAHMEKRIKRFLAAVDDDCVLIVTHGGCARAILADALGAPATSDRCAMKQNEIITIERTADHGVKVHREEA